MSFDGAVIREQGVTFGDSELTLGQALFDAATEIVPERQGVLVVPDLVSLGLIEVRDATSGEVVKLIEIAIMCWPKREHDRGESPRR